MSKHFVIYIPGLGDSRVSGQQKAVNLWHRFHGVKPYLFQMKWADGEAFQPKFDRLLQVIDTAHADGYSVSLIAASAGGSAAMNAFAARRDVISAVGLICGQIMGGTRHVSRQTYQSNPAFFESMERVQASLDVLAESDRQRIISLHPLMDAWVPIKDTRVPGSKEVIMPVSGHMAGIAYGITISMRKIISFIRDNDSKNDKQCKKIYILIHFIDIICKHERI